MQMHRMIKTLIYECLIFLCVREEISQIADFVVIVHITVQIGLFVPQAE